MGNFCACTITTSPQIMPPKHVLPIHTNSITKPLHTAHTGHISATVSVSIYCARRADVAPRPHRAVSTLKGQPLQGSLHSFMLCLEGGVWGMKPISPKSKCQ